MLLHLVCFKYKAETDQATRALHRERLRALATLDGVVDLKVGEDVVRNPARSYDTGLCMTFHNRAALDAYASNPTHVPVAQFGAGISEHVVACDFEI
jgi:stress responsive alpha/beta barrel protein